MVVPLIFALLASGSFDEVFRAGLMALQKGDVSAAVGKLEEAEKLSPRDGRVWVALSQAYWKLHQEAQANEAAGKAAQLAPQDAAVQESLSIYYAETGQMLKAAEAAAVYASKGPPSTQGRQRAIDLYFAAAKPLLERQKFAEAAPILEEGSKRLPKSAQLELALGVSYYGLRRFNDAADAFLRTIDADPEIEQPHAFLGKMLDQIPGKLPQVTQRFEDWDVKHPANAAGWLRHAMALDAQSIEPETSLRLIEKSLAIAADNGTAHFEMGTVLDRLQRYPAAAAAFEKAAALTPDDPAPHYRLARDYDRIGKHDAAEAERQKHAQLVKAQDAGR